MTASVNILRGDLHLALSTAFNRGRYVLMTAGDGSPLEITIDIRERDDDLFDDGPTAGDELAAEIYGSDDHGPTIPAQPVWTGVDLGAGRDVSVYEFALQDVKRTPAEERLDWTLKLADIVEADAPDYQSARAADWVHVYDRVTRERRTLKRPAPDAVLTGLRDVAADLRGRTATGYPFDQGGVTAVSVDSLRGAPVEPPFGCAALPPVGPLTSVDGLRVGDIVRIDYVSPEWCGVGPVTSIDDQIIVGVMHPTMGDGGFELKDLQFVGRPDADGWMTWAGGENPVPGARIKARFDSGEASELMPSDAYRWEWLNGGAYGDLLAFRIVDTPPAA